MTAPYKRMLLEVLRVMQTYFDMKHNRMWLRGSLKALISTYAPLTPSQKKLLYNLAYDTACTDASRKVVDYTTPSRCKPVVELMGKFERHNSSVERRKEVMSQVSRGRRGDAFALGGQSGYPQVFFICSHHSNCAKDHIEFQGMIYVDRFWKSTLEKHNCPFWMIKRVEKYIKDNDIRSVQYIMGPPVYMCTRPYCKHFMTPIDLLSVLTARTPEDFAPQVKTRERRTKRYATYEYIKKRL